MTSSLFPCMGFHARMLSNRILCWRKLFGLTKNFSLQSGTYATSGSVFVSYASCFYLAKWSQIATPRSAAGGWGISHIFSLVLFSSTVSTEIKSFYLKFGCALFCYLVFFEIIESFACPKPVNVVFSPQHKTGLRYAMKISSGNLVHLFFQLSFHFNVHFGFFSRNLEQNF